MSTHLVCRRRPRYQRDRSHPAGRLADYIVHVTEVPQHTHDVGAAFLTGHKLPIAPTSASITATSLAAVRYCEDAHRHRAVSVEDAVNRRRGDLVELSHSIHAEPELAFAEHKSCAKTQALVAEHGFEITAAPGGLDTAFRAEFGSGPLVIGICAEYDALPGSDMPAATTSSPPRPSARRWHWPRWPTTSA